MISSQSEHPDVAFQILTLASAPDLVAQYSVDSAHLAVRQAATQESVYESDAFLQAVSYMLDYTALGPNHEDEGEYKDTLYEAISAVEQGFMTPDVALSWLETQLQTALGSELEIDTATMLVDARSSEPETLDPHWMYGTGTLSQRVAAQVYETLLFHEREDPAAWVPQLATAWQISADARASRSMRAAR